MQACLLAFGALAVGRHLPGIQERPWSFANTQTSPSTLLLLFWMSFSMGFLYMLLAVNFNVVELVHYFLEPRFTQPWSRGKYGDWKALLTEIGAVIYLVPPIAGIVVGRVSVYSKGARGAVLLATIFTMFYGFTSGTRNLSAVFAITFAIGYFFSQGRVLSARVRIVAGLSVLLLAVSAYYGVQFRNIGLGQYLSGVRDEGAEAPSLFIDNNLYVISLLTHIFPAEHEFLGMAVPLWMVERPIPRALWEGKPDGSGVTAETYLGDVGATVASTFIGESFMAAGFTGVAIAGICLGALARWWTARAYTLHSDFGVLIYSSGFFAVVMTMRSLYQLPVAMLPTVAAVLFGLALRKTTRQRL